MRVCVCVSVCAHGRGCCAGGRTRAQGLSVCAHTLVWVYIPTPRCDTLMCTQGSRKGEPGEHTPLHLGCANWHMHLPRTPGLCCQVGPWAGGYEGGCPCPGPVGVGSQQGLGYFLEILQHSFQCK